MRKLKWFGRILILFFVLACIVSSCLTSRMSDKEMNTYFKDSRFRPQRHFYEAIGRNLHFVEMGDTTKTPLLFVHGSPGSWDNYKAFLKDTFLLNHCKIMSVDRPGFGYSDEGGGEVSLKNQAAALLPILRRQKEPVILVGHSYGGPVVVRAAIDYPQYIRGIVLVAASIDPDLEPSNWYRYLLKYTPLRLAIPSFIRSSNDELLPLKTELKDMSGQWNKIQCKAVIVQGGKDMLVPPDNAKFAQKKLQHLNPSLIWKAEMNHFVPWSDPDLILEGIKKILD